MHLMHRIPSLPTHPGIPPRGAEKSSDTAATVRFQDLLRRLRPNRLGGGPLPQCLGPKRVLSIVPNEVLPSFNGVNHWLRLVGIDDVWDWKSDMNTPN